MRLSYGVYPNGEYRGALTYGADIRFSRWACIESRFYQRNVSLAVYRRIDRLSRGLSRSAAVISGAVNWFKIASALDHFRERLLHWTSSGAPVEFDAFLLECYSAESKPFNLLLRCDSAKVVYFQHAFPVNPGYNFFEVPFAEMGYTTYSTGDRMTLFPENNVEARLVITWCTFVKYAPLAARLMAPEKPAAEPIETNGAVPPAIAIKRELPEGRPAASPAPKVKCVCWDLDDTLWDGILIEDGPNKVAVRPKMARVVRALDERGILQTIVSKNTFEQAWPLIERAGLQDYFLYPAINWNPKSINIRTIAKQLNIGLETIVLIDDSAFERAEVNLTLPAVRVYKESEAEALSDYAEFRVPVSPESKGRRLSYLTEIERQRVQQESGVDNVEFLRQCQMVVHAFQPVEPADVERCWELCQRSNQLNLSTRRYTQEEFKALLTLPGVRCFAIKSRDRFGDYGIIAFCSVDDQTAADGPKIMDFVISCRVAKKHVEQTFIQWLAKEARDRGKSTLRAHFVETPKNSPMAEVLSSLPFRVLPMDEKTLLYEMPLHGKLRIDDLHTLIVN
jgi:FkbH-like protein